MRIGPAIRLMTAALLLVAVARPLGARVANGFEGPAPLTYGELVRLYEHEKPSGPLRLKLEALLTTPFVSAAPGGRARPVG